LTLLGELCLERGQNTVYLEYYPKEAGNDKSGERSSHHEALVALHHQQPALTNGPILLPLCFPHVASPRQYLKNHFLEAKVLFISVLRF